MKIILIASGNCLFRGLEVRNTKLFPLLNKYLSFNTFQKMKRIFYVIVFYIFFSCTVNPTSKDAVIQFKNLEKNLGELEYQKEEEYSFEFENPGETPLIIQNVETSCGCTAADWSQKPIKPEDKGEIKIKYDADFPGVFQKTITVHYNGEDSPAILKISGQVRYPEDMN